jgi:NAD(P)H dehydrogenase (quinone)
MTTTLVVLAHHRATSLTAKVAMRARRRLEAVGGVVDFLDLYAEGFDPRMTPADEPDWDDPDKAYSAEVESHMRRIDAASAVVVVFPVWWSAPPAILKGWVDRVWNHGFAYGPGARRWGARRLTGKRMLWLGLAAGSKKSLDVHASAELVDRQLRLEVSHFCGIADASVRLLRDTHVYAPEAAYELRRLFSAADAILDEFARPRVPTLPGA